MIHALDVTEKRHALDVTEKRHALDVTENIVTDQENNTEETQSFFQHFLPPPIGSSKFRPLIL